MPATLLTAPHAPHIVSDLHGVPTPTPDLDHDKSVQTIGAGPASAETPPQIAYDDTVWGTFANMMPGDTPEEVTTRINDAVAALELHGYDVKVVDLKTGQITTPSALGDDDRFSIKSIERDGKVVATDVKPIVDSILAMEAWEAQIAATSHTQVARDQRARA